MDLGRVIPVSNHSPSGLTVRVDLQNTDKFKELAELISNMLRDKRIDEEIRQEYLGSFEKIIKRMNDV